MRITLISAILILLISSCKKDSYYKSDKRIVNSDNIVVRSLGPDSLGFCGFVMIDYNPIEVYKPINLDSSFMKSSILISQCRATFEVLGDEFICKDSWIEPVNGKVITRVIKLVKIIDIEKR